MKRRHRESQEAHSRVIRPGDAPEWISVLHTDGSISEVRISADDDELNIDMHAAYHKHPHLRGL